LFLGAATLSTLVSGNLLSALGIWKAYFVEPFLLFLVFVNIWKKKDFGLLLKVLAIQVLVLSLFAGYQKITGGFISNHFWQAVETRRVTSFFAYPNALALYVTPLVAMFLGYGIYLKKVNWKKSLFFLLVFVIGFFTIYWTKSKGALISVVASLFFYTLFFKNFRKYFIYLIVSLLVGFGIFVASMGLGDFDLRGQATVEGGDSVSVRQDMWLETSQMLGDNFWTGAGLASYQEKMAPYHLKDYIEIYLYPHNFVLNFWSEIGLLGLVGFLILTGWFFGKRQNSISEKNSAKIWIIKAGMFGLLVHGLVDVPYFKNDLAVLWWVIVGLLFVMDNIET